MQQRIDSLAQQVEHNTFNVGVLGSSPRRITQKKAIVGVLGSSPRRITQKKAIILKKVIAFFIFARMVPDEVLVGQRKNLRTSLFRHKF